MNIDPLVPRLHVELANNWHANLARRLRVADWIAENLDDIHARAEALVPAPEGSNSVFVYWAQGFESAPDIVQRCHAQLVKASGGLVVSLDETNAAAMANLPLEITSNERIGRAHFSDVLRVALLFRHGGTWVDATCLCTSRPSELIGGRPFYAFSFLQPKARISNWFLSAKRGSYICRMMCAALAHYWQSPSPPRLGYHFFHDIFEALYFIDRQFAREWGAAGTADRDPPHFLQQNLLKPMSKRVFSHLVKRSPVHKLTYKFEDPRSDKKLTLGRLRSRYPLP